MSVPVVCIGCGARRDTAADLEAGMCSDCVPGHVPGRFRGELEATSTDISRYRDAVRRARQLMRDSARPETMAA